MAVTASRDMYAGTFDTLTEVRDSVVAQPCERPGHPLVQAANGGLVDLLGVGGDQQLLQGVVHIERLHIAGREPQLPFIRKSASSLIVAAGLTALKSTKKDSLYK